jgi:CheY-like chemotaxis protein
MARVLVVEDDPDIRELEADALKSEGHLVYPAENGREGLRLAQVVHPDVVVLDLMMPVMTGWEFRAAQRVDPELCEVPVIVVSAVAGDGLAAARTLAKPFELSELLRAVEQVLRATSSRGAGPAHP